MLLLFDDDKIKIARKPGKKQRENPVGCTGEGRRLSGNIRKRRVNESYNHQTYRMVVR